jgi:hypothetical protein
LAGTLAGALNGADLLPEDWVTTMEAANRTRFSPVAEEMTAVALEIFEKDRARWDARRQAIEKLA